MARLVIERMAARYTERLPLMPGAVEAVRRLAADWPLGLASSSPPSLIGTVLDAASLHVCFAAVMSTEQVARGKPAPDIYRAVTGRLGRRPQRCAAVEDSSNGLRSAAAAGLRVIAIPHPRYPPDPDALGQAAAVLPGLAELTRTSSPAWTARTCRGRAGDRRASRRPGTRRGSPSALTWWPGRVLPPAGRCTGRRAEGWFTRAAAGR